MLTPELHDAAQAFGRALRQTPAVAAYRAATDALADDLDAQQTMMALRGPQASYVRTQQAGLSRARNRSTSSVAARTRSGPTRSS